MTERERFIMALRREPMQGRSYIFCSSNCIYTGLPLERYELMNRLWWEEGICR